MRIDIAGLVREAAAGRPAAEPMHRRLYWALRENMLNGRLPAGLQLTPSRLLAEELQVARNTVLDAYAQLQAEGYLETDGRRGSRVTDLPHRPLPGKAGPAGQAAVPALSRRAEAMADWTRVDEAEGFRDHRGAFLVGMPEVEDFPLRRWKQCFDHAWGSFTTRDLAVFHGAGDPVLRQAVAAYLQASRAVRCDWTQVMITTGTQQSLQICASLLADHGDTVWVENPGYLGARQAFALAGLQLRGFPVGDEGIEIPASAWTALPPPKLLYLTPTHQYPLGNVLPAARRLALVQQMQAAGGWLIEDDYDSEFRYDTAPLAAMQGLVPGAPVIYLGTFSKVLAPGLRLGYCVVPEALVPAATRMLAHMYRDGRVIDQRTLAEFINRGWFTVYLRQMREVYKGRREQMLAALERELGGRCRVLGGAAGLHLTAEFLPDRHGRRINDRAATAAAAACGLLVRSLSDYGGLEAPGEPRRTGWVLGYATTPDAEIGPAVRRLAEALDAAERAVPNASPPTRPAGC